MGKMRTEQHGAVALLGGDIVGGQPQVWGFCSSQNSLFSSFHLASVHGEIAMACVCYKDQI